MNEPKIDTLGFTVSFLQKHRIVLIIAAMFLVVCGICLNNIVIYTPDSARYVAWAKSLSDFEGYKDETGLEPSRYVIHAPLYPLLLAPVARFFPYSVIAMKATTILFGVFALFAFSAWLNTRVPAYVAGFASAVFVLNPLVILYSTQVLSDVAFAACLICFFVFLEKDAGHANKRAFVGVLITATAAVFLREVGLTVMMTAAAFYATKKEYQKALLSCFVPVVWYLLWVVRNEIVVAGFEMPVMRNSQIFMTHLFTPQDASMTREFAERFLSNVKVYSNLVGQLVFMPEYTSRSYGAVSTSDFLVQSAWAYVDYARIPLIGLTLGLSVLGILRQWKSSLAGRITLLFLGFYSMPILLYPINDIRFLVPLIPIMLFHGVHGFRELQHFLQRRMKSGVVTVLMSVLCMACIFPNVAWLSNYVFNNRLYAQVMSGRESPERIKQLPDHFKRPIDMVGQWIARNSDSSTVVGSVWKELFFWLEGRKIVEMSPQIILDGFDHLIRDYNVGFLVSAVGISGLREYELQMASSFRFDFETVYRVGNLEVNKVSRKSFAKNPPPVPQNASYERLNDILREKEIQSNLRFGLQRLEVNSIQAESVFTEIWKTRTSFGTIVFYTAVAKEFNDSLDQASELFGRFRSIPQAGSLLTQAWYHQEIITRLRSAQQETDPVRRAEKFYILGVNYWELAFRKRAVDMLQRSLEADSSFFPALVFGSLYAFQNGDTVLARRYHRMASSVDPSNELTKAFSVVFKHLDSLQGKMGDSKRLRHRIAIAREYIRMGIREMAIDELLQVVRENPKTPEALEVLVEAYVVKRRFGPALVYTRELLAVDPSNEYGKQKLAELLERW